MHAGAGVWGGSGIYVHPTKYSNDINISSQKHQISIKGRGSRRSCPFFMLAHLDGFILATLLAKLELFLDVFYLFCVDFAINYQ